jgi:AraC family transcriptional regulator, regulatory protein of adaptative response / DNA-3-methyladenine glycosylase II
VVPSPEVCERAVRSRDPRFDGVFVTGVTSTGIYCRPSCPAVTPKSRNMRFFPAAASAHAAGFRSCKRCRPDAAPGSPQWDVRADLVGRAMRLIADGEVDRAGVPGLAQRLGYSRRAVERALTAELGAGPLALARAQRAHTARVLIETTGLPFTDIAYAAGFASIRQFNETVQQVFALTPTALRATAVAREPTRHATAPTSAGDAPFATITVRLPFRSPLHPDNLFGHLVATGVPGVEEWRGGAYRRTLRLPRAAGVAALRLEADHVQAVLHLGDVRDLPVAVARCRRLLDLDADPVAVDAALAEDPALAPLVAAVPGRRVPRTVDEQELAMRAVLGQQVSTAAARTHAARLSVALGDPVADPIGGLTRLFPSPEQLAQADDATLTAAAALPWTRRTTLVALATALATGEVDLSPGADRAAARASLVALPGVGPWTVETVAMRALGDPDAFPSSDLGVVAAARGLGLPDRPAGLLARAEAWRPWRAYATQHLWGCCDHPVNRFPTDPPVPTQESP